MKYRSVVQSVNELTVADLGQCVSSAGRKDLCWVEKKAVAAQGIRAMSRACDGAHH